MTAISATDVIYFHTTTGQLQNNDNPNEVRLTLTRFNIHQDIELKSLKTFTATYLENIEDYSAMMRQGFPDISDVELVGLYDEFCQHRYRLYQMGFILFNPKKRLNSLYQIG